VSYSKSKAALGLAGLVTALAAGAAVLYGRVRSVEVPQPAHWPGVALVCAGEGVDRVALVEAIDQLEEHGQKARLLARGEDCTPRDGIVAVRVDPSLDTEAGMGGGIEADGDEPRIVWGLTHVVAEGERIRSATVRLHPRQDATGDAHELLHALGWEHPKFAPTGHVLHPSNPSLRDWRGVE
jgi:hypothetical protein